MPRSAVDWLVGGAPALPLSPVSDWAAPLPLGNFGSGQALPIDRGGSGGALPIDRTQDAGALRIDYVAPGQRAQEKAEKRENARQVGAQASGVAQAAQGRAATGGVPAAVPAEYQATLAAAAAQYGVDPALLAAQIKQESGFNPQAQGPATQYGQARGIAQFIPGTAAQYGVNVNDPHSSIQGMAHYMSDLLQQYGGNQQEALAAYNGGPGAVQALRAGRPYGETRTYLDRVQGYQQAYRTAAPAPSAAPAAATTSGGVPNPAGQQFLASAMTYQGVNYVWGGSSRSPGVDCSGLVIAAARDSGRPLSGRPTAQGIYNTVPKVDMVDVQPGDLVFFEGTAGANAGERISHVGIVTEAGMMLNAPQPGATVTVAPYTSAYWAPKIAGFGRLP